MTDKTEALDLQNQARQEVSVEHGARPDLAWDDTLAENAQKWADKMASDDDLNHSEPSIREGQGENIAFYSGTDAQPSLVIGVQEWLAEKPNYNGEKVGETGPGGGNESWGHYTQIIWPTTTKVGVAIAQAANGGFYICGRFSPPGNWMGESAWLK